MGFYESTFPVKAGDRVIGRVYLRKSGSGVFQPGITLGAQLARGLDAVVWLGVHGRAQACADYGVDECRQRTAA